MHCHSCGITIPSDAEYCPNCGAKVAGATLAPLSRKQVKTTRGSSSPPHAASEQNQPKQPVLGKTSSPKVNRIRLGLGLLALVLVGGGLFLLLGQGKKMDTERSTLLQNPYPPHLGTLVLDNPLSWNSNGYYYWQQDTSSSSDGCRFVAGAYHVTVTESGYDWSCLVTGNFADFAYQVQMKIVRGDGGGIVLHSSPNLENFYSFIFNKQGEYEFDYYNNTMGSVKITSGHSSAFHVGLNQTNLVAAVARERNSIDLYVNLHFVIHISGITYGQIGVSASDVSNPTEVAFSNAKVWTITPTSSQRSAAATMSAVAMKTAVTSSQNPYPPFSGTLALQDPLTDNSRGYNWESDKAADSTGGICQFRQGAYYTSESVRGNFQLCAASATNFNNFAYQVQMTIVKGDIGGIVFRMDTTGNNFYYFNISRFGAYALDIYNSQGYLKTVSGGTISAFHSGLNQTNLIAVVAQGHTIDLYVNLRFIAGVSDSTYGVGQIGVVADDEGSVAEVVFSNAKVWKL